MDRVIQLRGKVIFLKVGARRQGAQRAWALGCLAAGEESLGREGAACGAQGAKQCWETTTVLPELQGWADLLDAAAPISHTPGLS